MKWIKITYHFCYRTFWYSMVALILAIAVGMSIIRLYLPDVKEHREEIEDFASAILEQDVLIESMEAKLTGFTPNIILNDVYLLDETGTQTIVHFEQARLTIDLLRSIYNFKLVPDSLTVIGVQLGIHRNAKGNFTIQGLDVGKIGEQLTTSQSTDHNEELARWFFERSRLSIKNSTVVWNDSENNKQIQFDNVNFQLLNDDERHQVTATVSLPPELGKDLEIAFDFSGNILNPREWSGDVFARADDLNLVNWGVKPSFKHVSLEQGTLGLSLWGKWEKGKLNSISADLKTKDVTLNLGNKGQDFHIDLLHGIVDWNRLNSGWKLNVNKFEYMASGNIWPESTVVVNYNKINDSISAYASYLKIEDIKEVLLKGELLDKTFSTTLERLAPEGFLSDLYADYSFSKNSDAYYFSTDFESIAIKEWQDYPGIKGLSGKIILNESDGMLTLDSNKISFNMSTMFRNPITINSAIGNINWFVENDAVHVRSSELLLDSDDISADLGFYAMIPIDKKSPYIDLQVSYKNGKAITTKNYLPVSIMGEELISWVDTAFQSGRITEGGVILNGRLSDFPYKNNTGLLYANFNVKDVDLNYQQGWPMVHVNDANIEVSSLGVTARSNNVTLYNSKLSGIKVSIHDFEQPLLKVRGRYKGYTTDLAEFLITSPVSPEAETIVRQSTISGNSSGEGRFQLPLADTTRSRFAMFYEGKVRIADNKIDTWNGKMVAENIQANISFSPKGVFSDNLDFLLNGGQTKGKLYTQIIAKKQNMKITMQGQMLADKIQDYLSSPMFRELSGTTNWQGVLNLGTANEPGYFQYISQLQGIHSNLPAPLNKKSEDLSLLDVRIMFPTDGKLPVRINYANKLSTALVFNLDSLDTRPLERGDVIFYDDNIKKTEHQLVASLPSKKELSLRGYLSSFNIDDWFDFAADNAETKNVGMMDLNIPIQVRMDYLEMVTNFVEGDEKKLRPARDPRKIPLFDVDIKSFKYDDRNYGHIRTQAERHPDGMRFTEIYIDAPYMHVEGEGSWFVRDGRQQTNLVAVVTTKDIGQALTELGFSATIEKGNAKSVIQAHWFDAPNRFTVEKLNANVGTVIENGVIRDIKPGAGRLLGLFSVAELPRRLLLDFGELEQGLAFQQIVGQLEIKDGDAFSDNVTIISPIAFITITGRTGLAKRDFDQRIRVSPSVSSTIPVISWLAWGGQIGALVFLLEKLVGEQMNNSISTDYTMTGSWDNPVIIKLKPVEAEESSGDEEEDTL